MVERAGTARRQAKREQSRSVNKESATWGWRWFAEGETATHALMRAWNPALSLRTKACPVEDSRSSFDE